MAAVIKPVCGGIPHKATNEEQQQRPEEEQKDVQKFAVTSKTKAPLGGRSSIFAASKAA